jgi:hypothetical protein
LKREEEREERAYKKDVSGFLPPHVRLLGVSDLRDEPV